MSRIAIVTGPDAPNLTTDGQQLREELAARGHGVDGACWNDETVDWHRYDAALVRSCWKYYQDPAAFRNWLDDLERAGVSIRNPPSVIRWNLHKSYLRALADAGTSIVPTEFVSDTRERDLAEILERRGWDGAVVKPVIGTSGAGAWKTTRERAGSDQSRFERPFRGARRSGTAAASDEAGPRLSRRGALVQRFVPEVADGERSLVFFEGEFSHAWTSLRAPDSFDVSANVDEFGAYSPAEGTISWARDVLRTATELQGLDRSALPYARVDCLRRAGTLLLMELELIEPHLNLSAADGAVDRLATAVLSSFEDAVRDGPSHG